MVERRQHLGFAFEAREPLAIGCEVFGQHLDGDVALELRIPGAIDLPHAASAERRDHLVRTNAGT